MACVGAFSCSPLCLNTLYGRVAHTSASFSLCGDENTISGCWCRLLALRSCVSVGRSVGRSVRWSSRRSARGSLRLSSLLSSVVVGRRCHHLVIVCRYLLAHCPSPRFAEPWLRRRSRPRVLSSCLLAVRWGAVSPSSPLYSTRRTGRCCGRSGGVIVPAMWRGRDRRTAWSSLVGAVCSLTWWGWAVLSFLLIVLALLLRLIPMSCSFLSSSFLFALPPPVGSSLLAGLN